MNEAFLSRDTGAIHFCGEFVDEEEEAVPDDIGDPERYIKIPHKNDLDLGERLVGRFVNEHLPEDAAEVAGYFERRGAYARLNDLLRRRGFLERWFEFEQSSCEAALREWCAKNDIELVKE
ncbi:MAG: hypothetical protein CMJ18_12765 [Phycisphaeraceae bacterium]|nr:hypothetical protein [Phycisphaeraceae bacterium]